MVADSQRLTSVVAIGGFDEGTLLALVVKIALGHVADVRVIPGKGVTGRIRRQFVALGNAELFAQLGIALGDLAEWAGNFESDGQTAIFLSVDGRPAGLLGVVDPARGLSAGFGGDHESQ